MNFIAAIDISTFIWCKNDYENNKSQYYTLLDVIPTIYDKIKIYKIPVLFRANLQNLVWDEFPYNMARTVKSDYPDFATLTLSFLVDTFPNWIEYSENNDDTITSVPILSKPYFSDALKTETQSQIVHLFQNGKNPEHKFISYKYFFNHNNNLLVLNQQQNAVEIDTLYYNSENQIIQFFERHKIKFKHNPKHNRYNAGGIVSPLSCYNERTGDVTKAQELLETACSVGKNRYNWDKYNNVYVQFVQSNDGTYHGFDISDEKNNVPYQIKKKFNKNGKVF